MNAFCPSLSSHHWPLGSLDPPGFSRGPTSSEPLTSILLRQPENLSAPRYGSIERPSTSRLAGLTPAISQVVGIRSVWFTKAFLVTPPLTPGPFAKKGTSALSQYGSSLRLMRCSPCRYPLSEVKKMTVLASCPVCPSALRIG